MVPVVLIGFLDKIHSIPIIGVSIELMTGTPMGTCLRNIDITPLSGRFSGKGVVLTVKGHESG